jgi:hypothetical protein
VTFALAGTVRSAEGTALGSAEVRVKSGANAGQRTTTDAEGRYRLTTLQGGEMLLEASASGCVAQSLAVALDADRSVDFTLAIEEPGTDPSPSPGPPPVPQPTVHHTLSGIVSVSGIVPVTGIAGARVEVVNGPTAGAHATTDKQGRYELTGLLDGTYTVGVSAGGYQSRTASISLQADKTSHFGLVPEAVTSGRVVDALTGSGLTDVSVDGDGIVASPVDGGGYFQIMAVDGSTGTHSVTFHGPGVVERTVRVTVPGADIRVTLIPAEFDLRAFDEMFRSPVLSRWTNAPPLVVETRTVQYTDMFMADAVALADTISDAQLSALIGDLEGSLGPLTAGSFTAFAKVGRQTTSVGQKVQLLNPGTITVVRAAGLTAATGLWGYGRWLSASGTVTGGLIVIDRDFDESGNPSVRSLRSHELGHALGYQHVTVRPSVMNATGRTALNQFDRDAARLAFQRPPGNRSPDVDPASTTVNRGAGGQWSEAQP